MTSLVTSDQLVPGLAVDINASTTAENLALKTAMVNAGILDGSGGGGGGSASATMAWHNLVTTPVGSSGANLTTTLASSFASSGDQYSTSNSHYRYYTFDNTTTSTFGTWASNREFTFSTTGIYTISGQCGGYLVFSNTTSFSQFLMQMSYVPSGQTGRWLWGRLDRIRGETDNSLVIIAGGYSLTRQFNAGDKIAMRVLATSNVAMNAGAGEYGFIGSSINAESYMSIVKHP